MGLHILVKETNFDFDYPEIAKNSGSTNHFGIF